MNITTERHPRKPPYKKSKAVLLLELMSMDEAHRLHPTCPHLAPRKFRDDKANDLTGCVVKYITLKGGFASRISNQGTFNRRTGKYIPATSRKGLADIMATYQGKSLHLEIKIGRDKQSEAQKKIESEVSLSGGLYFIAKDFGSFKNWFDTL